MASLPPGRLVPCAVRCHRQRTTGCEAPLWARLPQRSLRHLNPWRIQLRAGPPRSWTHQRSADCGDDPGMREAPRRSRLPRRSRRRPKPGRLRLRGGGPLREPRAPVARASCPEPREIQPRSGLEGRFRRPWSFRDRASLGHGLEAPCHVGDIVLASGGWWRAACMGDSEQWSAGRAQGHTPGRGRAKAA